MRNINKKLTKKEKEVLVIKKILYGNPKEDLSNPEVFRKYCRKYGEAIRPGLERVDRAIARSAENMFRVVRYS